MKYVTNIVKTPEMILRIMAFERFELPKVAALNPVMASAIITEINVAVTLNLAGNMVMASKGSKDPIGKEIIDAMAAA